MFCVCVVGVFLLVSFNCVCQGGAVGNTESCLALNFFLCAMGILKRRLGAAASLFMTRAEPGAR